MDILVFFFPIAIVKLPEACGHISAWDIWDLLHPSVRVYNMTMDMSRPQKMCDHTQNEHRLADWTRIIYHGLSMVQRLTMFNHGLTIV